MEIQNYEPINLSNIKFPFTIGESEIEGSVVSMQINDIPFKFYDRDKYRYMWYCIKRQIDYNIVPEIIPGTPLVEDMKEYPVFDSAFNLLTSFDYIQLRDGELEKYRKQHSRKVEKVFWGTLIDNEKVLIGKNRMIDYSLTPDNDHTIRVLVQPEGYAWDEGFFVYITKSNNRPNRSLDVLHSFRKENNFLTHRETLADGWIY